MKLLIGNQSRKKPINNQIDRVYSPAKINLSLHVYRPYPNGYHPIQSVFQRISLADELLIQTMPGKGLRINSEYPNLPVEKNILHRVYDMVKDHLDYGFDIQIIKNIPMGGGLGGGSSNAASFLSWIIKTFNLDWSSELIVEKALQVGADLPFFMSGYSSAWVEGIGERITEIPKTTTPYFVLVFPGIHSSTPDAYRQLDESDSLEYLDQSARNIPSTSETFDKNDFQPLLWSQYPVLNSLSSKFPSLRLSGSGSTSFIPCLSQETAQNIVDECSLEYPDMKTSIVTPV